MLNIKKNFQNENHSNYNDSSLAKKVPYLIKELNGCGLFKKKFKLIQILPMNYYFLN
jgi:hypothetical protein